MYIDLNMNKQGQTMQAETDSPIVTAFSIKKRDNTLEVDLLSFTYIYSYNYCFYGSYIDVSSSINSISILEKTL